MKTDFNRFLRYQKHPLALYTRHISHISTTHCLIHKSTHGYWICIVLQYLCTEKTGCSKVQGPTAAWTVSGPASASLACCWSESFASGITTVPFCSCPSFHIAHLLNSWKLWQWHKVQSILQQQGWRSANPSSLRLLWKWLWAIDLCRHGLRRGWNANVVKVHFLYIAYQYPVLSTNILPWV